MMPRLLKSAITPKNALLVGKCISHEIPKETKVRVTVLEFDSYLNTYFSKYSDIIAHDENQKCKDGDIVLLNVIQEQVKTHINHKIVKILYPYGDVADPITGKKCVKGQYRDVMKFEEDIYGKEDGDSTGFDYNSAPDRGWQEGKKDFSYKVGYLKFHEFPVGHPKHNDQAGI